MEDQRQRLQAQAVCLQRVVVPLDVAHAPKIGMQRPRCLMQPRFVVLILLLEVLRTQE